MRMEKRENRDFQQKKLSIHSVEVIYIQYFHNITSDSGKTQTLLLLSILEN